MSRIMTRTKPKPPAEEPTWGATVEAVVDANFAIARPFGGGLFSSTSPRYQLTGHEHDAIATMSAACDEYPALRAIAAWAEANGVPEALLEAWESAKHGTRWAVEGRERPEDWKPYRSGRSAGPQVRESAQETRGNPKEA